MRRSAQDRDIALRRIKFYRAIAPISDRNPAYWRSASEHASYLRRIAQAGRYRKRKPLDCGKTRCGTCHGDKWPRRLSPAELRADEAETEELRMLASLMTMPRWAREEYESEMFEMT